MVLASSCIKAILFDLDGVLVDTRALMAGTVANCFLVHGLRPPSYSEVMDKVHRLNLKEMVEALLPNCNDRKVIDKVAVQIEKAFINHYTPEYVTQVEKALETLAELKKQGFLLQ